MFKNSVFRTSIDTKRWFKAAMLRAIKTVAQTSISLITVGQAFVEINWVNVLSIAMTAGIISILTSITGLPEESEE